MYLKAKFSHLVFTGSVKPCRLLEKNFTEEFPRKIIYGDEWTSP